jgi:hypothetical protein
LVLICLSSASSSDIKCSRSLFICFHPALF